MLTAKFFGLVLPLSVLGVPGGRDGVEAVRDLGQLVATGHSAAPILARSQQRLSSQGPSSAYPRKVPAAPTLAIVPEETGQHGR
ncbi:hypothetical protein MY5147_009708 [Beauveria neobassiana]